MCRCCKVLFDTPATNLNRDPDGMHGMHHAYFALHSQWLDGWIVDAKPNDPRGGLTRDEMSSHLTQEKYVAGWV
jgi:hypothetical protein